MSVNIRRMTEEEFEIFCRWSIDRHTEELMEENRISWQEAHREAGKEVAQMLPAGLHTAHNQLMIVEENQKEPVGFIWTLHEVFQGKKQSFLCDFIILESKRRQGFGAAALALMEKKAAEADCRESVLFVPDKNHAAGALYRKTGYQILRQHNHGKYMVKQL